MRRAIRPGESVSETIIRAVADVTERDPVELKPIGESIDVESLDSLFMRSSKKRIESLTLLYEGCRVTVEEGFVIVEEIESVQ